jgi:hypothetical protein
MFLRILDRHSNAIVRTLIALVPQWNRTKTTNDLWTCYTDDMNNREGERRMRKAGFNYAKLGALLLVLVIALTQSVSATRPTNSGSSYTGFDEPDLSGESRTIESFNNDFITYNKRGVELSKRSTVTRQEFNSLENLGNDLKGRVSQLRDSVQSIITKLKSTGRWGNLDAEILEKLTEADDRAFLQRNGGLRRILENAVTELDSDSANEIVAPLSRLRSKVAIQTQKLKPDSSREVQLRIVMASYERPALNSSVPLFTRGFGCMLATVHYSAHLIRTGKGSKPLNDNMHCKCDGSRCLSGDSSIAIW